MKNGVERLRPRGTLLFFVADEDMFIYKGTRAVASLILGRFLSFITWLFLAGWMAWSRHRASFQLARCNRLQPAATCKWQSCRNGYLGASWQVSMQHSNFDDEVMKRAMYGPPPPPHLLQPRPNSAKESCTSNLAKLAKLLEAG